MKKGLSVFALAALLFGVGAVADSNHEVQAKSHSKGGSVKRAKATPVRRAVARPVARRAVARPVARRVVAKPVARRVVAKPVARKATTRPVVRKTTPTVRKTATRSVVRKTTPTVRKTATKSVVRKTTPTVKTAVVRKATTPKKGTKTAVVRKATTAKKGTKTAVANKATAAKKGTKTVATNKATAATNKATEAKKGKFKLPLHGNYCGPGHGDLTKNPKPVDTLDAICRKHDIGYKKDGYFSRKANAEFVKDVAKNFNKMKPAEKVKAAIFSAGFIAMNNTPLREVSTIVGRITGK